ncbi:hypothetical protein DSO57_1001534 [Entomophthora muscae]|uniref:Uncharacterized protein n=1 Tax=Entomophthora muscae TaxID=34485 RepID=A0ACC2RP04_9FUNG|nr:hypothetical protein DSO57_1001534 [Entomophthora muscae]
MVLRDMVFYYLHRLFHHPFLYATFHKKHHEFTAPIAVSALYANPIDFALTNVGPLLIGPLILNCHPVTVWLYFAEAIIETTSVHSGFNFPGFPNADMHDYHHETFNNMFSLLGLGDYIHGTDIKFKQRNMNKEKTK